MVLGALKKALYTRLFLHLRFRYFLPRGIYAIPIIEEICHWAECPNCGEDIEAQGWHVEYKRKKKKIYEVTFKATETRQSEGSEDKEDEEEEDEEFKVRRPKRLTVGRKRPKTPKGRFYVV